ncbi:MAG: ATP-binding protein [Akkermansiaceae bacterium]
MSDAIAKRRDREAALRQAFRDDERGIAFTHARGAAIFVALFMLTASLVDWVILPERAAEFLMIRATCAVLLGLIYWHLGKSRQTKKSTIVAQGVALVPILSLCLMIAITDGGNSVYYAGLNLVLVGLPLLLRWRFSNALLMILATFLFYSLSVISSSVTPEFRILFGNGFYLFVTSVFVLVGCYFYEKLRYREFCLRTELEKSGQLLEIQKRQLTELDEAKARFFSTISRQLRAPLSLMLGITERMRIVLSQQSGDPVLREMALSLEENGLRLLKHIDSLLELVRFDTGHGEINRQPTLIGAHLEGLLGSLRHLAQDDGVALTWDVRTDSEFIQLDRDKFDKVLLNLVINAIKFTPSSGTIEVEVGVVSNRLRLTVEDNGIGIPPEKLPRIFERFWQGDSPSTDKFQGAGIGLALVRSLTEAMDGQVRVDSEFGKGTIFTIELPTEAAETQTGSADWVEEEPLDLAALRRAALPIPDQMQPSSAIPMHLPGPMAPAMIGGYQSVARPLVLIADDDSEVRRFLRMELQNVDVIEASDGAEALELSRLRRPQLALLAHRMSEMDGAEVCRRIREDPSTRGVAVIILTARADEQTKLSALQAGANDFLTKPFSTAELSLRLENQIAMVRIRGEMADLNSELHTALEQIKENEVVMFRNEKLSALGRMSAGIIHEINNPLNYTNAGIHALGTFTKLIPASDQEDFVDILKDIREGVERVSQIVMDLRKFTSGDNATTGDANLVEIIGQSRRMVSHQVGKDIAFHLVSPDNALIRGNSNLLIQVFINFFQNSIDAIHMRIEAMGGDPGRIDCTIEPAGEGWQVTTRDNGIGIPLEDMHKIFDPFFTSKDVGKGMGLGLSIAHQILQSHQAMVDVESRPNEFTRFRIVFPGVGFSPDSSESVLDPLA